MTVDQYELEYTEEELGAVETEVITPGKIVPYEYGLPSSNISIMKDFDTDVLLNQCHTFSSSLLSVTFTEYGQNVDKHDTS